MYLTICLLWFTAAAAQHAALEGRYQFRVELVADNPEVSYPLDSVSNSHYKIPTFPTSYEVMFFANGDSVSINPGAYIGIRDLSTLEKSAYTLSGGDLFAGGGFAVRTDLVPFMAELTVYGSGVPIVSSQRGSLLYADDPNHDLWFMGHWLIYQPRLDYSSTLYHFNDDGSISLVEQRPASYHAGSICQTDSSISCTFGSQWRSAGKDTLFITINCTDSIVREAAFFFADTMTRCMNPQIWCGQPSGQSVDGDTTWNHCTFDWSWMRCTYSLSNCFRPFETALINPGSDPVQNLPMKPQGSHLGSIMLNPLTSTAIIEFFLPVQTYVALSLYDFNGHHIMTLAKGHYSQGHHRVSFNTTRLPAGRYAYRLNSMSL